MASGGKNISAVKLYRCGYCENNLANVFRGHSPETRRFPALAALISHRRLGYLLYDTGYSQAVYQNGLISALYCRINPTTCKPGDRITDKLHRDGIDPGAVRTVILSHAHPDHIGGLPLLRDYRLLATRETLEAIARPTLRGLVFRNMLPDRAVPLLPLQRRGFQHFLHRYFGPVYDILGDGSLVGVRLDGHSAGQLGVFLPEWNLLLAADASWGGDLLRQAPAMRLAARLIQNDYAAYCHTAAKLLALKREHPEITQVFSHEDFQEGVYAK